MAKTLAETLMFPAVLFLGLLTCFPWAFHAPQPHHTKVVVAREDLERKVDVALQRLDPGGFDVSGVTDAQQARKAVLDRDAVAGYAAEGGRTVLYIAQANGASLEQNLAKDFTQLAARAHQQLTVTDVARAASKDQNGTTIVYLCVAWSVPGYILATTLLRAVTFNRRKKVATIAGVSALFSCVGFVAGVCLEYVPNDPEALFVAFLLTAAVATFSAGVAPFTKQFFPLVGMGLFIVLSVPTSGVAPIPLLPTFFQDLHTVMPLGNAVDALKGIMYFEGAGVLRPVLVLCAWITAGLALLGLDARRHRHKVLRSEVEGTQDEEVPEPPVEDPSVEAPTPTAIPIHRHHFGDLLPMLEGTVCDDMQHPIHHAAVTVIDARGQQLVRTVTDDHGRYAVTGLPEEVINVVVSSAGRISTVHQKALQIGSSVRGDFILHIRSDAMAPHLLARD
ncbi:carboxypeptidase regulatory-like domain-containing protein [Streptomyces sp. NPDC060187]|uniref:carboxypeptidase regulatory-like domain-containing protein n=1 Tax=Streptomyces sp. NPDC060187 TaxID=3347067 RepID=UPI00365C9343